MDVDLLIRVVNMIVRNSDDQIVVNMDSFLMNCKSIIHRLKWNRLRFCCQISPLLLVAYFELKSDCSSSVSSATITVDCCSVNVRRSRRRPRRRA